MLFVGGQTHLKTYKLTNLQTYKITNLHFNLNIKKERSYATKIVSQQNKGNFATRTTTKI